MPGDQKGPPNGVFVPDFEPLGADAPVLRSLHNRGVVELRSHQFWLVARP